MDEKRRNSNTSVTTAGAAAGNAPLESGPEGLRGQDDASSSSSAEGGGHKAVTNDDDNLLRDAFDEAGDDVEKGDRIQFKTMGWVQAGALISAETIALGILSFPSVFHRLGMAIGIVVTLAMALISWWTGYILVQMKVNFPGIHNYADAGRVVGGRWLHALFAIMLAVKVTFVAGSHSLSGGIALTNISSNAICSVAYAAIISVVSFLLILPRTFEKASYISFVSVISILTACIIVIAASGTQSLETLQRATRKDLGPVEWHAVGSPGLVDAVGAISNIVFAYGGHVAIFSFCAEMKQPQDFKYSLAFVQTVATAFYILVGATIYSFEGQYVTSPALTATSSAVRITAYSIALISIIVAGVVASYVAAKFIWTQLFRGTRLYTSKSAKAWSAWTAICATIWTLAFIISELIPFFNELLTIISSLLTVWFTYGLSSVFWYYMNDAKRSASLRLTSGPGGWFGTRWKTFLAISSALLIIMSAMLTGLGTYSAAEGIRTGYSSGKYSHPFACVAS